MNLSINLKNNIKNIPFYNYVRVLATLLLLVTHSIMMDMLSIQEMSAIKTYLCKFIPTIAISCNILFLFLSGALLLPYKEESIFEFYKRRFIKLLVPMLVYYLFYMYVTGQVSFFPPKGFNIYLTNFLSGTVNEAPHMWILYQILAFYIICPFIRIFLKYVDYKTLTILIIISLICLSLNTITNYCFNMGFILSNPLNEIFIIPVIGYFINLDESRKYDKLFIGFGILSMILTAIICNYNANYLQICSNASPIAVLIGTFFYVSFKNIPSKYLKNNFFINLIAKYSFSIVLIHWFVISNIVMNRFNIHATQYKMLGIIPSVILSLIFSLLISIVIDNTIIKLIYIILNKLFEKKES